MENERDEVDDHGEGKVRGAGTQDVAVVESVLRIGRVYSLRRRNHTLPWTQNPPSAAQTNFDSGEPLSPNPERLIISRRDHMAPGQV